MYSIYYIEIAYLVNCCFAKLVNFAGVGSGYLIEENCL